MDFLKHKMGKPVFHGSVHVPVHFQRLRDSGGAIHVIEADLVACQLHDMVLRDHKIVPGIGDEGG